MSAAEPALPGAVPRLSWSGARLRGRLALLLLPAVLLLLLVYVLPVGRLLLSSLHAPDWSTATFAQLLGDRALWSILGHTFVLAGEVTLLCALLGYPVAYMLLMAPARWRQILLLVIVLPIWTSVLVRAYAWMVLLGRNGLVNQVLGDAGLTDEPVQFLYTRAAVVIGLVHVMLPYFVLPLYGVMKRIDLRLVAAAEGLGAGRTAAFLCVFLPLSLPGVASGGLLTFILSIGFFVTPALLGGLQETTYVMVIEKQVNQVMDWNMAAAMSVVLLVGTLLLVALWSRLLGFGAIRGEVAASGGRLGGRLLPILVGRAAALGRRLPVRPRRGRRRHRLPAAITWAVALFVLLPVLIFFPLSFSASPYLEFPPPSFSTKWYANYFARQDWVQPTLLSFEVALLTTVLATLIGSAAAVAIARGRFPGRGACLGLMTLPAVTPTLVVAVGLYIQFAQWRLVGSVPGLVLGHLVIALPLVVIVVLGALRKVDEAPERAARSLGAHPVRAFLAVTLPLLRPSILSAAFFAFLTSFDDVVVALFLSGTRAATLPKRMWDGVILEIDPTIAAVSTLLILLSTLLLVASQLLARRARRRGIPVE